jgi:hypothetical protein
MRRHPEQGSSRSVRDARHPANRAFARHWIRCICTRTRIGAVLLTSACSLAVACGGRSATAPASSALPLVPGRQLLTLAGFASSTDPLFPPCTPIGQPRDGTSVNTVVSLTKEGAEWIARSEPSMGSVELHLRSTGSSTGGYGVAGTITGTALDIGLMGVVRDVRVTLGSASGGSATFDGETTTPMSSLVVGRMTGALRFSDSQGLSSSCPAIQWSMQPY